MFPLTTSMKHKAGTVWYLWLDYFFCKRGGNIPSTPRTNVKEQKAGGQWGVRGAWGRALPAGSGAEPCGMATRPQLLGGFHRGTHRDRREARGQARHKAVELEEAGGGALGLNHSLLLTCCPYRNA